jgi:precorrin-6A synthase
LPRSLIGATTESQTGNPGGTGGARALMRKLSIIGIGAGNPDYITMQAIKVLRTVDVVFLIDKGSEKEQLTRLRKEICDRYIENKSYRIVEAKDPERDRAPACYEAAVEAWHTQRAAIYEVMIRTGLADGEHGAFLVWGDPCLYDSTLRVVDLVTAMRTVTFELDVIPGITGMQALAARHKIALNRIGGAVQITTGRRLAGGMPREADDVVVMLDGKGAFKHVHDDDIDVYWGAYLGMPDEVLLAGKLSECAAEIESARNEARSKHGWMMDIYLLRRRTGS